MVLCAGHLVKHTFYTFMQTKRDIITCKMMSFKAAGEQILAVLWSFPS